jgi:hypothetical protein
MKTAVKNLSTLTALLLFAAATYAIERYVPEIQGRLRKSGFPGYANVQAPEIVFEAVGARPVSLQSYYFGAEGWIAQTRRVFDKDGIYTTRSDHSPGVN